MAKRSEFQLNEPRHANGQLLRAGAEFTAIDNEHANRGKRPDFTVAKRAV
jgi:hypothetical protein